MKKMTNVAIYTVTFLAISVWAVTSFASRIEGVDSGEYFHNQRVEAAQKVISDIEKLSERLDGVLRTYETDGDAKMGPELENLKSEARTIINNLNSGKNYSDLSIYKRSTKEIELDVKTIQNRISEIEQGAQ